ncbi:MAG: hypothetical protein IKR18_10870 [Bacteroidaceae bacterium]|nr:hypothetical protein [Bacteroidaceae bacterium]
MNKEIAIYMLACSVIALFLNPMTWLMASSVLVLLTEWGLIVPYALYALIGVLPYVTIGTLVWSLLINKKWQLQTINIWLSVNSVILFLVLLFINSLFHQDNGVHCISPLAVLLPVFFAVSSILSVIPIGFCCHRYKHKNGRQYFVSVK